MHDQPQVTFENLDLTASLQCCMHLHAEIYRRSAVALDSTGSSPLSTVGVAILNCGRKCREEASQMRFLDYFRRFFLSGVLFFYQKLISSAAMFFPLKFLVTGVIVTGLAKGQLP